MIDEEIKNAITAELIRQQNTIELIASENIVSQDVLNAAGSILTNKYAEGYPSKRYYAGCEHVDEIENIAINRAKELFSCEFANVQPHSGSQANQAVMFALASPGDVFLSLSLAQGGHLTHGSAVNQSGKWFKPVHFNLNKETYEIDYEEVRKLAIEHNPKIIIAGGSAYPRGINFKKFQEIAKEAGAYLFVDMAHIAGLVAAGAHMSPLPYADVVTTTTHKTLRGPRGGLILTNNAEIAAKINKAIFPGLQGGPLMHIIAAKAVAFKEALAPEFKNYIQRVLENCKILAQELIKRGYNIVTNGTDTHLLLVDLRKQGLKGNIVEKALDEAGLACNKNNVPFDAESPFVTSGIRLGSAAATTRGFGKQEFEKVANMIADILDALVEEDKNIQEIIKQTKEKTKDLCKNFPIYRDVK